MAFAPSLVTSRVVPGLFETCSAHGSHAVHNLVAGIRFFPALAVRLLLDQSVSADSLRASTGQDATTSKRRGRGATLSGDLTVGLALHASTAAASISTATDLLRSVTESTSR